jgi:serine/threonine-protein kinase
MKPIADALLHVAETGVFSQPLFQEIDQRARPSRAMRRAADFCQLKAEGLAFHGLPGAIEALADSDRFRLIDIVWLDRCPLFAPLRAEPAFAAIRNSVVARAAAVATAFKPTA